MLICCPVVVLRMIRPLPSQPFGHVGGQICCTCTVVRMARPHSAGGRIVRPLRAQPLSSEKYIQCSTSCVTCAHLPPTLGGPLLAHMKTYIQCNISCVPCAHLPIILAGCSVRPKIVHVYKRISTSICLLNVSSTYVCLNPVRASCIRGSRQ